ncbi:MAG: hypothetical protein AAFO91_08725, partial [Bacteroidota bacterium]
VEEVCRLHQTGRPVLLGVDNVSESEKFSRLLNMRGIDHNLLNAKHHQRESEIIAAAGKRGKVTISARMAGRGTDIKLTEESIALGGLAVIGAQRYGSRRDDEQLKGRAGRQGMPGSCTFFISLEDRLMLYFNVNRMAKWMDRAGLKEGEVIEAKLMNRAIKNAQRKVEKHQALIRQSSYRFDEELQIARELVYERRRNALNRLPRLRVDIMNMFEDVVRSMIRENPYDFASFQMHFKDVIGVYPPCDAISYLQDSNISNELTRFCYDDVYLPNIKRISKAILPKIQEISDDQDSNYKRILIPISDGEIGPFAITTDIFGANETEGRTVIDDIESGVIVHILDQEWFSFLKVHDDIKARASDRSRLEKKEALDIFKELFLARYQVLLDDLSEVTVSFLCRMELSLGESRNPIGRRTPIPRRTAPKTFVRQSSKIAPEDPCPCGSSKPYNQCHGKASPQVSSE